MAKVLPIVAYGDPVLKQEAEEIEEGHEGLTELIENMWATMYNAQGVGLAAPQIGESIRVFIVDAAPFGEVDEEEGEVDDDEKKYLRSFKKVFINPEIIEESGESWAFNEGCLSIPFIREDVKREPRILLGYQDEQFEYHEEEFDGYAARIIQHEYDHLEGVLFTDRINPLKRRLLKRRLEEISKGEIDVKYKMRFPTKKR